MRKRRVRVGKVRGPHVVVLAKELPRPWSERVILESSPHVAPYILTWLERQLLGVSNLGMHVVETVHPVCHPPHVVFCRHDFQGGEPLEHAAVYQPRETLLNNMDHVNLQVRCGWHGWRERHAGYKRLVQGD